MYQFSPERGSDIRAALGAYAPWPKAGFAGPWDPAAHPRRRDRLRRWRVYAVLWNGQRHNMAAPVWSVVDAWQSVELVFNRLQTAGFRNFSWNRMFPKWEHTTVNG